MAYCKKCGTTLKKYSEFCPLCGAPTGMNPEDFSESEKNKFAHDSSGKRGFREFYQKSYKSKKTDDVRKSKVSDYSSNNIQQTDFPQKKQTSQPAFQEKSASQTVHHETQSQSFSDSGRSYSRTGSDYSNQPKNEYQSVFTEDHTFSSIDGVTSQTEESGYHQHSFSSEQSGHSQKKENTRISGGSSDFQQTKQWDNGYGEFSQNTGYTSEFQDAQTDYSPRYDEHNRMNHKNAGADNTYRRPNTENPHYNYVRAEDREEYERLLKEDSFRREAYRHHPYFRTTVSKFQTLSLLIIFDILFQFIFPLFILFNPFVAIYGYLTTNYAYNFMNSGYITELRNEVWMVKNFFIAQIVLMAVAFLWIMIPDQNPLDTNSAPIIILHIILYILTLINWLKCRKLAKILKKLQEKPEITEPEKGAFDGIVILVIFMGFIIIASGIIVLAAGN